MKPRNWEDYPQPIMESVFHFAHHSSEIEPLTYHFDEVRHARRFLRQLYRFFDRLKNAEDERGRELYNVRRDVRVRWGPRHGAATDGPAWLEVSLRPECRAFKQRTPFDPDLVYRPALGDEMPNRRREADAEPPLVPLGGGDGDAPGMAVTDDSVPLLPEGVESEFMQDSGEGEDGT